jgi:hypothetical protein
LPKSFQTVTFSGHFFTTTDFCSFCRIHTWQMTLHIQSGRKAFFLSKGSENGEKLMFGGGDCHYAIPASSSPTEDTPNWNGV